MKQALQKFEKKHGKASFKGKRSYILVRRTIRDVKTFLKTLINDENVVNRVTSVTL